MIFSIGRRISNTHHHLDALHEGQRSDLISSNLRAASHIDAYSDLVHSLLFTHTHFGHSTLCTSGPYTVCICISHVVWEFKTCCVAREVHSERGGSEVLSAHKECGRSQACSALPPEWLICGVHVSPTNGLHFLLSHLDLLLYGDGNLPVRYSKRFISSGSLAILSGPCLPEQSGAGNADILRKHRRELFIVLSVRKMPLAVVQLEETGNDVPLCVSACLVRSMRPKELTCGLRLRGTARPWTNSKTALVRLP
jgi:hypothetical protein